VSLPLQSALYAGGITTFLALVGKSRPGYFLQATAYISAANLSIAAIDGYSRREINRAIFKLDNVEPKPGKLWERTKYWTVDDMVIGGGILGTFLALNPRALPGVNGWKRFLGAATIGCATGAYVGPRQTRVIRVPPQFMGLMQTAETQIGQMQYERLKEDTKAQETLSRFGKIAFAFYTWPIWGLSINPFKTGAESGAGGMAGAVGGGFQPGQLAQDPHAGISKEEMEQHTLVQIEFNKGELRGPDVEHGYRAYKDNLTDRDTNALQEWLERLEEIRSTTATEAQYVWQYLATKEHEFYTIQADDREKDIVRRELQLLNNMASDFATRDAILAYHVADVRKRLEQPGKKEAVTQNLIIKTHPMPAELPEDWRNRYSPHLVAEQVRLNWSRQKELLGFLEQSTTMHGDFKPEPGSIQETHLKQIKQNAEDMKKNVEATERLLKEFEEQMRRAEKYIEEPSKSVDP
jgi:hypothetical protein